jgi:hypothetical protein
MSTYVLYDVLPQREAACVTDGRPCGVDVLEVGRRRAILFIGTHVIAGQALKIECGDFFILGEAERVMEVREGWRVLFRAEHCFRKSQVREWVWDPKAGSRHPKEGVSSG